MLTLKDEFALGCSSGRDLGYMGEREEMVEKVNEFESICKAGCCSVVQWITSWEKTGRAKGCSGEVIGKVSIAISLLVASESDDKKGSKTPMSSDKAQRKTNLLKNFISFCVFIVVT